MERLPGEEDGRATFRLGAMNRPKKYRRFEGGKRGVSETALEPYINTLAGVRGLGANS